MARSLVQAAKGDGLVCKPESDVIHPTGFSACIVYLFLVLGLERGEERDHVADVRVR